MLKNREFGERVRAEVERKLGDGFNVALMDVRKNNGILLSGINILDKGRTIGLNIYSEGYECELEKGKFGSLEAVAEEVISVYSESVKNIWEENELQDIGNLLHDKEWVLSKVYPKMVNAERNKRMLEGMPHKRFLDLAVTYYIRLAEQEGIGVPSIAVDNKNMEYCGVTAEELDKAALDNIQKGFLTVLSLESVIAELTGRSIPEREDFPVFVATNKTRLYGAAAMLSYDTLDEVCDRCGKDLIVLPSSVHEVLLMPKSREFKENELKDMVGSVNKTAVDEEEYLSGEVYIYSRGSRQMAVA